MYTTPFLAVHRQLYIYVTLSLTDWKALLKNITITITIGLTYVRVSYVRGSDVRGLMFGVLMFGVQPRTSEFGRSGFSDVGGSYVRGSTPNVRI